MVLNTYSIYDRKAERYHAPFFTTTHGEATRIVQDLVADTTTTINRHPADYGLYHVGTYNDGDAGLVDLSNVLIVECLSLVPRQPLPMFDQAVDGGAPVKPAPKASRPRKRR